MITAIKLAAGSVGPQLSLRIPEFENHFLRPVTTCAAQIDRQDVECLTRWRNLHPRAFLTEFTATPERTTRWLVECVGIDETRVLFMLEDHQGTRMGYMGLAFIDWGGSYVEADAVVSGGQTPRGLMRAALCTMIDWARGALGLARIGVRVLSDNPALGFYQRMGFVEEARVPLVCEARSGMVMWRMAPELPHAERCLVFHRLTQRATPNCNHQESER